MCWCWTRSVQQVGQRDRCCLTGGAAGGGTETERDD